MALLLERAVGDIADLEHFLTKMFSFLLKHDGISIHFIFQFVSAQKKRLNV